MTEILKVTPGPNSGGSRVCRSQPRDQNQASCQGQENCSTLGMVALPADTWASLAGPRPTELGARQGSVTVSAAASKRWNSASPPQVLHHHSHLRPQDMSPCHRDTVLGPAGEAPAGEAHVSAGRAPILSMLAVFLATSDLKTRAHVTETLSWLYPQALRVSLQPK